MTDLFAGEDERVPFSVLADVPQTVPILDMEDTA